MKRLVGLVLIACLALSLGGLTAVTSAAEEMTFYVIAHTGPGDPFWAVVQRGVQDAGKALGVRAIFQGPAGRNIPEQVNMFRAAVAAKAAGIAVSISDPKAWQEPVKDARKQGIPVVAINCQEPPELAGTIPYMAYVGMNEYEAGKMVARYMMPKLKKGARAVVAIQEAGHIGLEARAKGISEVLTQELGGKVDKLDITQDPTQAIGILRSYLKANPDTTAIFTVGPLGAIPTIKMIREDGLKGKVLMASFDLDPTTIQAIKDGICEATVDQQQYLQGYISVVQLYLHAKYKLNPADYNTGSGLVTAENAAAVEALVKQGYR
ncbi:MAG: substrate-binding domain-containing protein [Bacillota bacterium]